MSSDEVSGEASDECLLEGALATGMHKVAISAIAAIDTCLIAPPNQSTARAGYVCRACLQFR